MFVVTAPEYYGLTIDRKKIYCFLAGGITDCSNWQKTVIDFLKVRENFMNLDNLVLFNPRRDNFPIDDPSAADQQIEWEYDWLGVSDIFSMYFDGGNSDQPICMYELGRYLTKMIMQDLAYDPTIKIPIISVNHEYKRQRDVFKQVELATGRSDLVKYATPEEHAFRIIEAYRALDNLNRFKI